MLKGNGNAMGTLKKIVSASTVAVLAFGSCFAMTGCMNASSIGTATTGGASSSNSANTTTVQQSTVDISLGAQNAMVNNALQLTVTDIQRRPLSVFSGASISGSDTSDSTVSSMSTSEIVIQVDVNFTWNINTYMAAAAAAGNSNPTEPSTLSDLLVPGTLMYIQGVDADGSPYMASDIVVPSDETEVNSLAINSQWDYAIIDADLPETSVQATGSILFRVASTAKDLQLVIITPTSGQEVTQPDDVIATGNTTTYTLQLS